MVKPDGVQRALVGQIIERFERVGLKLVALKMFQPTKKQLEDFYPSDETWFRIVGEKAKESYAAQGKEDKRNPIEIGKWVKQRLVQYVSSGPCVAMVWEGNSAVLLGRKLVGATDPFKATPGTIRGDFTTESIILADSQQRAARNTIHASGAVDEAKHEIKVVFGEEKTIDYKRCDEDILYSTKWGE
jgi:nucleoside-diphosphate kinase